MGRDPTRPIRPDWSAVKDDVMRRAVLKKFETHSDIRAALLATGDRKLVEASPFDRYWGCGRNGTGLNKLGRILMEIRERLRGAGAGRR